MSLVITLIHDVMFSHGVHGGAKLPFTPLITINYNVQLHELFRTNV